MSPLPLLLSPSRWSPSSRSSSPGSAAPPPRPAIRSPARCTPATCRAPTDVLGLRAGFAGGHLRRGGAVSASGRRCQLRRQGRRDGGVRAGPRALVRRGGQAEGRSGRAGRGQGCCATRSTSKAQAARIADRAPAIAWVAGNVHGNEESGTDAALAGPARPGRPDRLRSQQDPRRRGDGDRADPEPGRSRARLPSQLLRLRPQPRLVRPHPARDRRQAATAAQVSRRCSSSTTTRWAPTTSSSRPTPTRSTTRSPTARSHGSTTSTAPR